MNRQSTATRKQSGMTLIELIVVLAIFLIVASITIFDYGRFRSSVSLQNLSDDIALSVRRAQNYAIGVQSSLMGFEYFRFGYGIHFSSLPPTSDNLAGSQKSFMLFTDLDGDMKYDHSPSRTACTSDTMGVGGDECLDMLNITSDDIISSICTSATDCMASAYVDITFLRPNPDAYICLNGSCSTMLSSVDIHIENRQSKETKVITISNAGQISIK